MRDPKSFKRTSDEVTEVRAKPPASAHRVLTQQAAFIAAIEGNYLVQVASGVTELAGVAALVAGHEELAEKHRKFGFVTVLTSTANLNMPRELRSQIEAMVGRFSGHYAVAPIIYDGWGFSATAARSLVTSINLSIQASHPNRVFSDLDAGLLWAQERFPNGTPDAAGLRTLITHLKSQLAGAVAALPQAHEARG